MNAIDMAVVQWFHDHRTPAMTALMQLWSDLNGNTPMLVWAALFAAYLLWKRRPDWALLVAIAVPGIELFNSLVKNVVQRPRPALDHAIEKYATYSFPSGHVAVGTLFYGLLAVYVISNTRRLPARLAAAATAFILVAGVGVSRLYLGVHYPTDVLGALVEGLAWIALGLNLRYRFASQTIRADP